MPFHIFTELIPSVITVSDHTEIAIAVQKPLLELRLLPDDTWERKRRWKKPAIKKKRRFGFAPVQVNVNALLCSDTSDSDSKEERAALRAMMKGESDSDSAEDFDDFDLGESSSEADSAGEAAG